MIRGKLIGFDKTDSDLVHGFHIHSVGTVANGCFDALKHFNPENMTHGAPYEQARYEYIDHAVYVVGYHTLGDNTNFWIIQF